MFSCENSACFHNWLPALRDHWAVCYLFLSVSRTNMSRYHALRVQVVYRHKISYSVLSRGLIRSTGSLNDDSFVAWLSIISIPIFFLSVHPYLRLAHQFNPMGSGLVCGPGCRVLDLPVRRQFCCTVFSTSTCRYKLGYSLVDLCSTC